MKAKELIHKIIPATLALYASLLVVHVYQIIMQPSQYLGQPVLFKYHLKGFVMDLEFTFIFGTVVLALCLLFYKLLGKYTVVLIHLLNVIALFANISLILYFLKANQPLGKVFFELSSTELKMASNPESFLNIVVLLALVGIITFYILTYYLFRKYSEHKWLKIGVVTLWLFSLVAIPWSILESKDKVGDMVANNKGLYFLNEARQYFFNTDASNFPFTEKDLRLMDASFFNNRHPEDIKHPFLHDFTNESSLNELLHHDSKRPPNIVYIIVESLSNHMFGEGADVSGRMMPFLDSLAQQSIYFPNVLSTCERTHNVLPASLASTPNPPNGMELQSDDFPRHWSLISLLQKHYFTRYYCGVYLDYANMKGYMNYHNIHYLVDNWEPQFSNKINGKLNPWGYPDKHLFEKSFVDLTRQANSKPRFDVFLTVSTHHPFLIPEQKRYLKIVQQRFKHVEKLKQQQEVALKKPESLATYAYTDDALRAYFEKVKKLPDFNNTIFIIFGDHGNHDLLFSGLDRYKTSMLIYSPLIKQPKTIRSVSTHLDIAPSILNFLRINYPAMQLPSRTPFYGGELDLNPNYECKRTLPLNTIQHENSHLVMGKYLVMDNVLYKLSNNLTPQVYRNENKQKQLEKQLELYNRLVKYQFNWNLLLPETLFDLYVEQTYFKLIYENKVVDDKQNLKSEFINIGNYPIANPKWKKMRLECELDAVLKDETYLDSIPKLTCSIENINNDGKKEVIVWKNITPRILQKFNKNSWNKITYVLDVDFRNIPKVNKNNQFSFYIYNVEKKPQQMKNISFKLFAAD
ncbi:MAG: LTA synthase family protein [Crocinitomicaceae bacterium]